MLKKIIFSLILILNIPQFIFASWDRIYLKEEQKTADKPSVHHNEFMANIYTPIDTNGFGLYYEITQTHFTAKDEKIFLGSDISFANNDLALRPSIIGYIDELLFIWDGFLGTGLVINNSDNKQVLGYITFGARFLWFLAKYDIEIDSNLNIKNKNLKYGLSFSI